jgi:predicted GNAT family acetyltransferase
MVDTGLEVSNNERDQRYELVVDGRPAFSEYRRDGDAIVFLHTEVPEELEGRGIGSQLVRAALDDVRAKGLRVIPLCPFVRAYIARHPEYLEIVDEAYRDKTRRSA